MVVDQAPSARWRAAPVDEETELARGVLAAPRTPALAGPAATAVRRRHFGHARATGAPTGGGSLIIAAACRLRGIVAMTTPAGMDSTVPRRRRYARSRFPAPSLASADTAFDA